MTRLLLKLGTGNELTEGEKLEMDKNIALILALSLTPTTILCFVSIIHLPFPELRFPFPVRHILRTKRSQAFPINYGIARTLERQ